jgi:hypothetical protein
VAWERCEEVGGVVGYNVRLESAQSAATRLLFCTTGVLLRRLTSDPALGGVTHVVLDEVHERDMHTDFLLVILRDLLAVRPDLRVVVMSATIQIELFIRYFRQRRLPATVLAAGPSQWEAILPAVAPAPEVAAPAAAAAVAAGTSSFTARTVLSPDVSLVHVPGSTFPVARWERVGVKGGGGGGGLVAIV